MTRPPSPPGRGHPASGETARGEGGLPWAALALLLALAGCGYAFTAGAGRMPAGAESVLVRPLANRTPDAEAGALVAAALRQELARRGAAGGEGAPARIEGTILESAASPSSPDGSTWRLALEVEARLLSGERALGQV